MSSVKVSVIIPTYRSWDLLEKCLEAISVQTFSEHFEVLVVNNDSDNTIPQHLKKYDNVIFLHESKPGSYVARNTAIRFSKGEILAFTDADCIPQPTWLENGVSLLENTSDVGIIAGNVKLFYKNEKKLTPAEMYDKYTAFRIKEYVYFGNCVTANWFSYKKVIVDFGGFDSKLKSGGDTKLSQMISKDKKLVYGEDVIVHHPARSTTQEIVTKYRRIIGGRYVEKFQGAQNYKFLKAVFEMIYKRLKFNLNFLFKGKYEVFYKMFLVNIILCPSLVVEAFRIITTGKTERK
jgi:glycosyltransferase involved in cell wall biosynthesis